MEAPHLKSSTFTASVFFHDQNLSRCIPFFLIIYNLTVNLANDIYLPSLPKIEHQFSTTSGLMQMTMTAWFMGVALPQLFLGPLTDRIGRTPVLFGGGICFVLSTIVCGLAPNIWVLILARFFQGVGVCSLNVASFSILNDLYAYKKRIGIMNYLNMCGSLAPLIGPVIGGYILLWYGWRTNFILITLLGIFSLMGLKIKLMESNLSLNSEALHLSWLSRNYISLLRNKIFLQHLIPYCLILGGLIAYLTVSPFLIIEKMHVAPQNFGYLQIPIFGAYVLGSFSLNIASSYFNIKKIITFGLWTVLVGSMSLIIGSYLVGNNLSLLILSMSLYALGFSLCASLLVAEVMSSASFLTGYAAALLGFGMALSCALASCLTSYFYHGAMLSIAWIIIAMVGFAVFSYRYFSTNAS